MATNNNVLVPPNITDELETIESPDIAQFEKQLIKIYQYQVSNLADNNKDIFLKQNSIKIIALKSEKILHMRIDNISSQEQVKNNQDEANSMRMFSYDTLTGKLETKETEMPGTLYVYSLQQVSKDPKLTSSYVFYTSSIDNGAIWNDETSHITLTNLSIFDTYKNSKLYIFSMKDRADGTFIKNIDVKVPFDTLISNIDGKGSYSLQNSNVWFDDLEFYINKSKNNHEKVLPWKVSITRVGDNVQIYSPWFDKNITIPFTLISQGTPRGGKQGTTDISDILNVDSAWKQEFKDIIGQLIIYSAIYASGFKQSNIPLAIMNAFKAQSNNLQFVIDNLLDEYVLTDPSLLHSSIYWKLKCAIAALSKNIKSKYSIANGLSDLHTFYLPWYFSISQDKIPTGTASVSNWFKNDGSYITGAWDGNVNVESNYFDVSLFPRLSIIDNDKMINISNDRIVYGLDQTYIWPKISDKIVENNFSTLPSQITNDKNYLNYFIYEIISDETADDINNKSFENFYGFVQSGTARHISSPFDLEDPGQKLFNNLGDLGKALSVPANAENIKYTDLTSYTKETIKWKFNCDPDFACEVGVPSVQGFCAPCPGPSGYPKTVCSVQCKYNLTWVKGVVDYDIPTSSPILNETNFIFSRNGIQSYLSQVDKNAFLQTYKTFNLIPIKNANWNLQNINKIRINGMFGGNLSITINYSNDTSDTIGILGNELDLFDNYDESISQTEIYF